MRHLVVAAQHEQRDAERRPRVRAGVEDAARLERGEPAIPSAPVLSSKSDGGAGVVDENSSVRVITTETGRLNRIASAPARGSSSTNLAPKPPPIAVATTRTRCSGSPSDSDTSERAENRPWVLVQIVSSPSGSTLASAARGSR